MLKQFVTDQCWGQEQIYYLGVGMWTPTLTRKCTTQTPGTPTQENIAPTQVNKYLNLILGDFIN